jgi:hypothetical protein
MMMNNDRRKAIRNIKAVKPSAANTKYKEQKVYAREPQVPLEGMADVF